MRQFLAGTVAEASTWCKLDSGGLTGSSWPCSTDMEVRRGRGYSGDGDTAGQRYSGDRILLDH